ncbi:hypothetical protein LCGC14_1862720, partial [marine sediment metagenome]
AGSRLSGPRRPLSPSGYAVPEPTPEPDVSRATIPAKKPRKRRAGAKPRTLREFVAELGGIQDETGELRAADLHLWHHRKYGGKPFQPRLVRDDGHPQEYIALRVMEEGYFPRGEIGSGAPTKAELIDALVDDGDRYSATDTAKVEARREQQEVEAAREESRFRMEQEADRLGISGEAVDRMEDEGLAEAIGRAQLDQAPSEDTDRVGDYVEDDVDRITREALADEEMTDAERTDYEDIPFPEAGAEPAPAEDVGPAVEPAEAAEPRETEGAATREKPPEVGGEAAPARAEREVPEWAQVTSLLPRLPDGTIEISTIEALFDVLPSGKTRWSDLTDVEKITLFDSAKTSGQITTEQTEQGEQIVVPGAEQRTGDEVRAAKKAEKAKDDRAKAELRGKQTKMGRSGQIGVDEQEGGMFATDEARGQGDMVGKPKEPTARERNKQALEADRAERQIQNRKLQWARRKGTPMGWLFTEISPNYEARIERALRPSAQGRWDAKIYPLPQGAGAPVATKNNFKTIARAKEWILNFARRIWRDESGAVPLPFEPPVPAFFSKALQVITEAKTQKASPDQWRATLRNAGVKDEEIAWLGLDSFFEGQKSVSRDDLEAYVSANQLEVKEVTKGGEGQRIGTSMQGEPVMAYDLRQERGGTKFSQWQLPGGENYRELLLTLPSKDKARPLHFDIIDDQNNLVADGIFHTNLEEELAWLRRLEPERTYHVEPSPSAEIGSPSDFTEGHFDEPNVLAHVRFNERTDADGKRTLFMEEIQSDWHAKGRRQGYAPDPAIFQGLRGKRDEAAKELADAETEFMAGLDEAIDAAALDNKPISVSALRFLKKRVAEGQWSPT